MILNEKAVLTRSFNNNIVLVRSSGMEKILFSKGIGFGRKFGDIIAEGTEVDKIFIIEDEENVRNFNNIITRVDSDFLAVCEEAIYEVSKVVKEDLNENIHIGLVDHLSFAVKRLQNNEEIQNPFLVEVQSLYSREYKLAEMIAEKIGKYSKVDIPDGEIGFIALHVHSAINNGKLSNTIKYTYLSNTIIKYVEDKLKVEISRTSLDYARFVTHIRFAIERILSNLPIDNDLTPVIQVKYKKSFKIAKEVSRIIEGNLFVDVSEAEVAYLAIHIERFRVSLKLK